MTLNEIFPDSEGFMEWLTNNCYSCEKLRDDTILYNPNCDLELVISYAYLDEEFDNELAQLITENGRPCKCKKFNSLN